MNRCRPGGVGWGLVRARFWFFAGCFGWVVACGSILGFEGHTLSEQDGSAGIGSGAFAGSASVPVKDPADSVEDSSGGADVAPENPTTGAGSTGTPALPGFGGAGSDGTGGAGWAGAPGAPGHCPLGENDSQQGRISAPFCPAGAKETCESLWLPGGRFEMGDGEAPSEASVCAEVSGFYLDRYEVTVARFRRFVDEYDLWHGAGHPKAGAGAHPKNEMTGWKSAWNVELPLDAAALRRALLREFRSTWSQVPAANEDLPINYLTWYLSAAFCGWNQGRLPTEAEWVFAAGGGSERRVYPWGNSKPTPTLALFASEFMAPVGSRPMGVARWGQLDMAGSVHEWVFDNHQPRPATCTDCATTTWAAVEPNNPLDRGYRGGSWMDEESGLLVAARGYENPRLMGRDRGIRCARDQ